MKKQELRRLLLLISTVDTDPDTFEFVLKRLVGILNGIESDSDDEDESRR